MGVEIEMNEKEIVAKYHIEDCTRCKNECASACPVFRHFGTNHPQQLAKKFLAGGEGESRDHKLVWTCVTCSRCEEMCPMGVDPFEVCLSIRRWQCHNDETRIPMATAEVFKRGYTQAVEKVDDLRASVGLTQKLVTITELPALHASFKDMLMEIDIIKNSAYMFEE